MKPISENEREVLNFITDFVNTYGYAPSNRDMCRELGIKSTSTVHARLLRLADCGYIRFGGSNLRRSIELTNKQPVVNVPLVGTIAAGVPIFAEENLDGIYPLPAEMFGNGKLFMLKVSGDSMINSGIFNGDTIVVKQQNTADNGQIVAAMIDDCATVKQFFKENGHYRLQPHNDEMDPIICSEVEILGIVVGLLRKL